MENMFIKAAQKKIRFQTAKGQLSVEDLFDLPLTSTTGKPNLDDIAKALYLDLKDSTEVQSFVDDTANATDSNTKLGLEIVKYVISVKKEERAAQSKAAENAALRQKIMAKIDAKKDSALDEKSAAELEDMLKSLS